MRGRTSRFGYLVAIAGGSVLWLFAHAVGGRNEAWDSPLYWLISYPLSIGLSAWLAWQLPDRPWRWGLAVMLVQAVWLAATAGGFGLLPLGMLLFAVLALPAIALSGIAARRGLTSRDNR